MASPTVPAAESPVAPARRTRRTDIWTTLFFFLTAALATWSMALIVLTLLAIIEPPADPDDDMYALKSVGAIALGFIALEQAFTMGAAMGKVPRFGMSMRTLMRTHRYMGRLGLVLAAVVAYFCMTNIGAPPRPIRGLVHAFFGSTGFLAIAIKLALLKWWPSLAFRAAPWLGAYAAGAFIIVAATSAVAYYLLDLG